MPTVTSLGIGSGIDLNSLVSGLMAVERQPLTALQTKMTSVNSQISAIGKLKSALSTFQDAMAKLTKESSFKVHSATSSDEDVLTASASSSAARGNYSVTVSRIAEYHRMAASTTYADSGTTAIGTSGDTMTITVGSDDFTVDIGGKTLAEIREAINDASDNTGVTASIIHDDAGYRLLLAAEETGSDNLIAASFSGSDPFSLSSLNTDRNGSGSFTAADLDAVVQLEGQFQITSSSNTVTDPIQGVSLELKAAGTTAVKVERDEDTIESNVKSFAEAASALFSSLDSLAVKDLKGYGSLLRGIESQVRGMLATSTSVGGSFSFVSEIGLQTQRDGSITLDSDLLSAALQSDFAGVAALFTDSSNGIAVRLDAIMDEYLQSGGILESQTDNLNNQLSSMKDKQSRLEARLDLIQNRYIKQFSALDTLLSSLQTTSSFLTAQLASTSR
ncbi:MAG: flagellar filament capping protein FliD [Gammaproteobacteria bacterium]